MAFLPGALTRRAYELALRREGAKDREVHLNVKGNSCVVRGLVLTLDLDRLCDFGEYVLFVEVPCVRCTEAAAYIRFQGFGQKYPNAVLCANCLTAGIRPRTVCVEVSAA